MRKVLRKSPVHLVAVLRRKESLAEMVVSIRDEPVCFLFNCIGNVFLFSLHEVFLCGLIIFAWEAILFIENIFTIIIVHL